MMEVRSNVEQKQILDAYHAAIYLLRVAFHSKLLQLSLIEILLQAEIKRSLQSLINFIREIIMQL